MLRKALLFLVSLFLLGCMITLYSDDGQKRREPSRKENVILISWDGVQLMHLKECLYRRELPNLAKLAKDGTIVEIYLTNKTDTKCGHAVMLTGYDPQVTGVFGNRKFKPIPEGYTIFERAENHFGKDRIVTLMLTGKGNNLGSKGPGIEKVRKGLRRVDGVDGLEHQGQPYYLTKKSLDVWDGDKARDATEVGPPALKYIEKFKEKRFLFFYHFSDPDHNGHRHGENSKEYTDAIITCDEWLGKIVGKLKECGIYEKTAIYVTSDHGFDEGGYGHSMAPYVFLVTNAQKNLRWGLQMDIAPTILEFLGVDVSGIEPPLWGVSLTKERPCWQPLTSEPKEQKQKPRVERAKRRNRRKR